MLGGGRIPGSLGLHPHSLHPANSTCAAKSPKVLERPEEGESGASGILPFGHESVFTPAQSRPSLGFFPRKGAYVARSPTRRDPPPGVDSGVPGFEVPPRGADSLPRAPSRAPARRRPHRDAFQIGGRHGEQRTGRAGGRAGCGERRGRGGDEPAAGRAPPGWLRLNGSNMATSWKLPLAAAAGEAAERAPPPPAGPASLPRSTPAQHAPRCWNRPGVSAARREVLAAGAAGTCSPRGGGPDCHVWGTRGASRGLLRVAGKLGQCTAQRGAACALGAPPPS